MKAGNLQRMMSERGQGYDLDVSGMTPVAFEDDGLPMEEKEVSPVPVPIPIPVPVTRPSNQSTSSHVDLGSSVGIGGTSKVLPIPKRVPWYQQLNWGLYKNWLLLRRRPIVVFCMLFSSVFSVLLAWAAGRDVDGVFPDQLDQCGVIPLDYLENNWNRGYDDYNGEDAEKGKDFVISLNDSWRNGVPVAVLSLGPFVQAVCAFLVVHFEVESKLKGVLKGLGMRESQFWLSWYLPFALSSFLNSLFGAFASQFLPVHLFQNVYFGGIFGSLFFLQLALVSASFFLVALCGSNNKLMVLIFVLMGSSSFVPCIINNTQGIAWLDVGTFLWDNYPDQSYAGLMWINQNTTNSASCNNPIMNEEQGTYYKTKNETYLVEPDEFFVGCYIQPGFTSAIWSPRSSSESFGLFSLFMMPYFHFSTIYSNFLGYTGMPNKEFGYSEARMSPENLAISLLPVPPNEENSKGTTLFPQGSTIMTHSYDDYEEEDVFRLKYRIPREIIDDTIFYGNDDYWSYEYPEEPHTCANTDGFGLCGSDYYSYGSDYYSYGSNYYSYADKYCDYAKNSKPIVDSPSVHDMFGYLFSLSVIYLILAAYWLQVFPAGNGAARKFYFFFDLRYWFGRRETGDERVIDVSNVTINSVTKNFGSLNAVKNLSLELKSGQITALLGHNGAGKSTLTNILSCEMAPSSGEVSIFGRSVALDADDIRCMVSICKQDDFLWPNLTAKEHLEFFAGLRGVDSDRQSSTVQRWLESVDLTVQQHMFSSAFSGGMKRRLSVALSTIGERPFVIFDEPTTGMDPVNRRFVWQHLDDIKENRVILLTTHAMEEADLLADEVAIMRKGELAAFGTPLELKSDHGSALQFSILVDSAKVQETENKILQIFEDERSAVAVESGDAGNITVNIERIGSDTSTGVEVATLTSFVEWLESDISDVQEYGFSNSSLEEVFIGITKDDEEPELRNEVPRRGSSNNMETASPPRDADTSIANVHVSNGDNIATFQPRLTVFNQIKALVLQMYIRKWKGRRSIFEYVLFGMITFGTVMMGFGIANVEGIGFTGIPLQVIPIGGMSFMIVSLVFPIYRDKSTGLFNLMCTQGLLRGSYIGGIATFAFLNELLFGLVLLLLLYSTALFRETKLCDEYYFTDEDTEGMGPSVCKGYQSFIPYQSLKYSFSLELGDNTLYFDRTPGGVSKVMAIPFLFALSTPGAVFLASVIPGNYKFATVLVAFITIVATIFPFGHALLWTYSYFDNYYYYYDDNYNNSTDISSVEECLLRIDPDSICSDIQENLNLAVSDIQDLLSPEQLLNCIGLNLATNTFTLPYICTPPYASLLPQNGAFQLLAMALISDIKFWPESAIAFKKIFPENIGITCSDDICQFPFVQLMYRQHLLYFALGALLLNIVGVVVFILVWFTPSTILIWKNSCSRAISNTIGQLFCRGKKEPFQENLESLEESMYQEVIDEEIKVDDIVRPLLKARNIEAVEAADESALEIDYVAKKSLREEIPPIVMHKVRKVYPASGRAPPNVAVKSLTLYVPKGQTLGLLGKNGSGKTTALKILSTDHKASTGLALVASYDVGCEKIQVYERLGNCPQFDVVWPFLTVGEHLEFFARLKGLPTGKVEAACNSIAKAVGLGTPEVYCRQAGHLSGGMRRRLSIAIAFIGAPQTLLLDEPTTGLDPSTRNEIWSLISSFAAEERAIIITTHMMIEADTLCNRIAIIGQGKLKVVATQQHLKDKYGSGYILQLNLIRSSQENQDKAMAFVRNHLHEDAILDNKQAKTLHVHLPRRTNLTRVFSALYSPERVTEGSINQFLLSQSSLEDVFLALGD